MKRLSDKNNIVVFFSDGENTAIAKFPFSKIKELIMDEANEMIRTPECNQSSCAVNNFCECEPINGDMEFAGIYLTTDK